MEDEYISESAEGQAIERQFDIGFDTASEALRIAAMALREIEDAFDALLFEEPT